MDRHCANTACAGLICSLFFVGGFLFPGAGNGWAQSAPAPSPMEIAQNGEKALPLLPGYSLNTASSDSQTTEDPLLIGYWEHRGRQSTISLEFLTPKQMVFAGKPLRYSRQDSTLFVRDEMGYTEYRYRIRGDTLTLTFRDASDRPVKLGFVRVDLSPELPDSH